MKRLLIILTLAGLPCAPFAQTRLTLDACIEQAEANNKALAAADRQLAAAQFDFRSARANFFPSFSATGTGLYSTADGGLDIAGGALPVLGVDGMPTGGTALFPGLNLAYEVGWVYGGGITLEQPLYMGGKVRTGYRMARIGSEMAEQNRRLTRSEVIVSTSRAYASVIRAREMRQVAERYHALLTELLRSVESARKHGLKPQNDVLKVRVKLNESELNLRRTECAAAGDDESLPPDRPSADRPDRGGGRSARPAVDAGARRRPYGASRIPASRPEGRAGARTVAPGAQRAVAAGGAGGQLRLPARRRTERTELVGRLGLHGRRAGVGADLPLRRPLEQGTVGTGAVRAGAGGASRRRRLEATQAANNLDEAQLEIRLAESSLAAADENLRLSRRQYEAGVETLSDHLEAQAMWQQAHRTEVEARIDGYLRWLEYRKAAGLLD